jgi:lipopolysaccharide/colanic/teichoic acid biosynthesis glycosyltransferase
MAKSGIEYMTSPERAILLDIPFAIGALVGTTAFSIGLLPAAMVASRSLHPFYHDRRLIPGGQPFGMYKYQTMPPKRQGETREITGRYHPDAGKLGNFIRHTGLDELPQAVHILSGKMSAVGPRPVLAATDTYMQEVGGMLYEDWLALVQGAEIRPGQFGPSQLYRRGHPDDVGDHAVRASLAIDLEYYGERATLTSDWRLITSSVASLAHLNSTLPEEIVERFVGSKPLNTL